jgi:hypothetical protein
VHREGAPVYDAKASRYRLVDRYVVEDGRLPLAAHVKDLLPADTEYVVLDLDRTVHLGITIGERLGWELTADPECRPDGDCDEPAALFSVRAPIRTMQILSRGTHYWGLPALTYACTVRLGNRSPACHRLLALMLEPGYVEQVQSLLRASLMSRASGYTPEQLAAFCERAWRRWRRRLVIDARVVAAIRAACPRLRAVLLSSASTAPTVEHAARMLGVDGFVSSAVDVYPDGEHAVYSSPAGVPFGFGRRRPRFVSRPGAVIHNAAANKINFLRVHYPEVFASGAVSVGITDNNYGEDRTWPNHLTHVVALNSRHPFSPFVESDSPCLSIRSADALPSDAGEAPRWHGTLRAGAYDRGALLERFAAGETTRMEFLVEQLRAARERAATAIDASCRSTIAAIAGGIADAVERYNRASARQQAPIGRELSRLTRRARRVRTRIARAGRECAHIQHELERMHNQAARLLVSRGS